MLTVDAPISANKAILEFIFSFSHARAYQLQPIGLHIHPQDIFCITMVIIQEGTYLSGWVAYETSYDVLIHVPREKICIPTI